MTTLHLDVSSSSQLFISHHEVYKELNAHLSCCTGMVTMGHVQVVV